MRRRRKPPVSLQSSLDADTALETMGEDELRQLIHDIIPWLDDPTHARLVNMVVDRATRRGAGWTPTTPKERDVARIIAFSEMAVRDGYADPTEVDDYLRQGSNAFLAKEYGVALRIFRALLLPIGQGEIHLGQHEMLDEVLNVDVAACAAHYVVATYMTVTAEERVEAFRSAIDDVGDVGHFWEPLRDMERVAVESLPAWDAFLRQWRALLESGPRVRHHGDSDTDEDRWLREVVERLEGPDGLARIARTTKRPSDLGEWCQALVRRKDWAAALGAFEEAAQMVSEDVFWRGNFLDGAALAAQELERDDMPQRLERAWQDAPTLLRLRRWLGASGDAQALKRRAVEAIQVCPKPALRQRALLHVLLGEFAKAAELLSSSPGMGWSNDEHPGHLLFPIFCEALGVDVPGLDHHMKSPLSHGLDIDELDPWDMETKSPHLATPSVEEILTLAGSSRDLRPADRAAILKALRKAAEKRLAGVTKHKRRHHYGHAAMLVAAGLAAEPTPEMTAWLEGIQTRYKRFRALRAELELHCKAARGR